MKSGLADLTALLILNTSNYSKGSSLFNENQSFDESMSVFFEVFALLGKNREIEIISTLNQTHYSLEFPIQFLSELLNVLMKQSIKRVHRSISLDSIPKVTAKTKTSRRASLNNDVNSSATPKIKNMSTIKAILKLFVEASKNTEFRLILDTLKLRKILVQVILTFDIPDKDFAFTNFSTSLVSGEVAAQAQPPKKQSKNLVPTLSLQLLRRLVPCTALPYLEIYKSISFDIQSQQADESMSKYFIEQDPNFHGFNFDPSVLLENINKGESVFNSILPKYLPNLNILSKSRDTDLSIPQIKRPQSLELKRLSLETILNSKPISETCRVVFDKSKHVQSGIPGDLEFDSNFQSGNLQIAIRVSEYKYNLLLSTDINSQIGKHNQWFYFSIKNMIPNVNYIFTIRNMSKPGSQFNLGMQPVMYSTLQESWTRAGSEIYYYKNHYYKVPRDICDKDNCDDTFSSLRFSINLPHYGDLVYLAYHYPYTYSNLLSDLLKISCFDHVNIQELCKTISGKTCHLVTITTPENIKDKPIIFLSARVHPGESNASHIMRGIIQFLASNTEVAQNLRNSINFKIIPSIAGLT